MKKFTYRCRFLLIGLCCAFFLGFQFKNETTDIATSIQETLYKHCNTDLEIPALKKFELIFTNNGFCRYRKYYADGKITYFAFNINRFKELEYLGTAASGNLYIHTLKDDVIVQTFNDKKGDVDSTATSLIIPLKNLEEEELNLLNDQFVAFKVALKK